MSIYQIITDKILAELKNGIIPWARPWKSHYQPPTNWISGRPYHGINRLLLEWNGQYASYQQITSAGGQVRKGAKAKIIVFWKPLEEKEQTEADPKTLKFCLRYYSVFEIGVDTEGIERRDLPALNSIGGDELICPYLKEGPALAHGYPSASYDAISDAIRMPAVSDFKNSDHYLKVLFHEAIHSTGHSDRLDRPLKYRSEDLKAYAKEELAAEIGSAFLLHRAGLDSEELLKQNTAYIQSWLRALEDNPMLIIPAASMAQKAVELITSYSEVLVEDHPAA